MTLKQILSTWWQSPTNCTEESDLLELETIADEFAIGFAEWLEINKQDVNYSQNHNTKELLEIYKKEKGL